MFRTKKHKGVDFLASVCYNGFSSQDRATSRTKNHRKGKNNMNKNNTKHESAVNTIYSADADTRRAIDRLYTKKGEAIKTLIISSLLALIIGMAIGWFTGLSSVRVVRVESEAPKAQTQSQSQNQ